MGSDIVLKDTLKLLREQKGLTKKQVADAIGVTERAYITYEYGQRDVSTETLQKLADFYHVTTDYLLGRGSIGSLTPSQKEALALERWLSLDDGKRAAVLQMMQSCLDAYEAADKSKEIKQDDNG